ncbi:tryptophan 2,3-dioxygenase [Paraburkholderia sp. NMBU_R16]|uniref:tryptophan 2,3-dioxygenase family protein n=1 Tax=Paraburkholderia sp. NMBU_R16 TaxID=2698676 RepID=UPI0015645740|nr:tryptophan 2,3-dioxygenase family protein [Paraburkholderia sp. NMBU_R16]NRO96543.1 tryptophan 2,3-dioxygenase [Paraburkholderia sp. NMBU_R16]
MKETNYWNYLKVEELLALQTGRGEEESGVGNDELLFIVVHQIYELWFKLILRELTFARNALSEEMPHDHRVAPVVRSLRRAIVIFEQANQHFRVIETMTTRDFLDFRDALTPASGFQSAQMREVEILLGLEEHERISLGNRCFKDALKSADGTPSWAARRVEERIAQGPSFKHCLYEWLSRLPIVGTVDGFIGDYVRAIRDENRGRAQMLVECGLPPDDIERLAVRRRADESNVEAYLRAQDDPEADSATRVKRRAVRAALLYIESYRERPELGWPRELIEAVLDFEQAFVIWRQRHARMVERIIGRRVGTGGSSGVDYLDETALRYRVFSDLWAARSLLLRKAAVPTLDPALEDR